VGDVILNPAGGNVGIGTTNPQRGFHVSQTTGDNEVGLFSTNQTSAYIRFLPTGPGGVPYRIGVNTNFMSFETGAGTSFMVINSSGNVGIGTVSPSERLHVEGNIRAGAFFYPSSRRWKTNIHPIEGALDKVHRLRGVSYD